MPALEFVCLANARKHLGRCVAGLKMDGTGWIRLVSKRPDGTLNWSHYMLQKGVDVGMLDVISAGVKTARPVIHQPENWVIDGAVWKRVPNPKPETLAAILKKALLEAPELFGGCRDRIAFVEVEENPPGASLALVAPPRIDLFPFLKLDGKRQVRGRFELGVAPKSCVFDLSVTDPIWESLVRTKGKQSLTQTEQKFLLTISLGEPFNGYCYKLIAAIIILPADIAKSF